LAFGLPNLTHLERGDYLCDLLEFVDEDGDPEMTEKKLAIKEFWTSEEYFFHSEDQVSFRFVYLNAPSVTTLQSHKSF